MSNNMTTTRNGIRVEDITFRGARKQSEIEKEIEQENAERGVESNVFSKVPNSLTPEQVISFFQSKIEATNNVQEKRVYAQAISWIEMYFDYRKKQLAALRNNPDVEFYSEEDIDNG